MLKNVGNKKRSSKKIIAGAVITVIGILALALLIFWFPRLTQEIFSYAVRVKNTFSFYVLQNKPFFYYLNIEKNGKDIHVGINDTLEISYRDELVIKGVASDDCRGKHTSARIEGMDNNRNYIGVILRGIELVDNIMQNETIDKSTQSVNRYKISIYYQKEKMAMVPIRVLITPQDWLRFIGDAGKINAQIEVLKKAIAENPEDAGVRRILAGIYLRQNRIDEAVELYEDILRIKPNDAATTKDLARCHLKSQQYDKVIDLLSPLAQPTAPDAEVHALLGLALGQKNLWAQSVEHYQQAVRIEPDNYSVRSMLAEAYENANQANLAIEQHQYIAAHGGDAAEAWRAIGDISLRGKRYDQAINSYKQSLKIKPKEGAVYASLAAAYAGQGFLKEEMETLQKAIALSPEEPVVRVNLAAAYERRNRTDDAVREYRHVLKMNPNDTDALERVADLTFKNKQYDQAVQYYEKLAGKYPHKPSIFINMGFAYGAIKQYARSAESYEKAVQLGAQNQTLYQNLAYTYTKLGRDKEAVDYYEKIFPQTKQNLGVMANYYLKSRNYAQAIACYQRIVQLAPDKASSHFSLGYAYAASRNWDKAIRSYLTALKYDREDDEIYANLGDAYEKKGLYREALKAYTQAYEINPETRVGRRIPALRIQLLQNND